MWDNNRLNRETLTLRSPDLSESKPSRRKCEVFNRDEFEKKWKELEDQYQLSINEQLKRNKI